MKKIYHIAVEGTIGVGKTSLAKILSKELQGRLVLEEFEDNPFLREFYKDRKRWAFQTIDFLSWLALIYLLLSTNGSERMFIRCLDGSIHALENLLRKLATCTRLMVPSLAGDLEFAKQIQPGGEKL